MKNLAFKLFLVVVFWLFLFSYVFPWHKYGIEIPFSGQDYKLWLDLQWWIELDYKVDLSQLKKEKEYDSNREESIIEWLKSIIEKRIGSLKINDSIITSASYAWEKHIIVQIPLKWNDSMENNENIERAKKAIWKVVKIEFKEERTQITEEDLKNRESLANAFLQEAKNSEYDFMVEAQKYKDNNENVFLWETWDLESVFSFSTWALDSIKTDKISENVIEVTDKVNGEGFLITSFDSEINSYKYLFLTKRPSNWKPAMDSKWRILNDQYFIKSSVQYDQAFQPNITLTFNDEWAEIFGELTKRLVGRRIAIFVWWENLTSPNVNEPILNWTARITWRYTPEEANELAQNINTWVVPAPIYLTSERTIDSRLWKDSLLQLIIAWVVGFVMILVFLFYVYRISGLIAGLALIIYIALVLFIIKLLWITLTLASIAWLVLSIGMAIDANILIFERIKDELRRKNPMNKSIKVWFAKSWSAIWDSNVTGLIISLILFIFWINMIKWFGLMLGLWIVVSLFSVMFISRMFIALIWKTGIKERNFIGKI